VYSESVSGQDLGAFWPGPGTRVAVLPVGLGQDRTAADVKGEEGCCIEGAT
jgi:hypothetical protein